MAVDEELLKPSREHLAMLRGKIATLQAETAQKIERYGRDEDREYAREAWGQFHMAVEPMYREIEAVVKTMVDYYAAQPPQPVILSDGQSPNR